MWERRPPRQAETKQCHQMEPAATLCSTSAAFHSSTACSTAKATAWKQPPSRHVHIRQTPACTSHSPDCKGGDAQQAIHRAGRVCGRLVQQIGVFQILCRLLLGRRCGDGGKHSRAGGRQEVGRAGTGQAQRRQGRWSRDRRSRANRCREGWGAAECRQVNAGWQANRQAGPIRACSADRGSLK